MGTSASSNGPGGGVPLVPPWVPPVPPAIPPVPPPDGQDAAPADGNGQNEPAPSGPNPQQTQPQQPSPLAPAGRFQGARLNFGKFAGGGEGGGGGGAGNRHMRRGLRDYVRKGYKGRESAVRRFGGTVSTADRLYGALSSMAGGHAAPGSPLDPALLGGRSAREVMDAIVEATRPVDGTQDAEASRYAIKDALSELLAMFPDADLRNLTEDQRSTAIERFVAIDVYRRAMLDIGSVIRAKAASATVALSRLKEVKDYIKQTVSAAFRKLRGAGHRVTTGRVSQVVRGALDETFKVFEEYRR